MTLDRILTRAAIVAVILYATLAGLRTLNDPDMWWQMSGGRFIAATGHIDRTEVFSYTAKGAPWIYPVGSGLLFHWLYTIGGFTLLSMLSPVVMGAIGWLLLRRGGIIQAWMAAWAIPSIALATVVRANMFSTLFAVVFLLILTTPSDVPSPPRRFSPLALLPLLMLLWVNLHPGFILGLALVAAFTIVRARELMLWTPLTFAATLVNPWGWRIYDGIRAQNDAMSVHSTFIREWRRTPLSPAILRDALNWRDVENAFWWLVAITCVGVLVALYHKRIWGPLLLAAAAGAALMYIRFQGLFAITAVIVAPPLLSPAFRDVRQREKIRAAAALLLIAFVAERSWNLVNNHQYRQHITMSDFGTGFPRWPPARAAAFIEQHNLPHQLYEDYIMGGYIGWRLGIPHQPAYPVFIDGRALPYGPEVFFQQLRLARLGPDDPEWQRARSQWNIHTVLISLDRFFGYRGAALPQFCNSKTFRLVYMDETAAVFVLSTDTDLLAIDCATISIPPSPALASGDPNDRYHFYADLGFLYYTLHRPQDAEEAILKAQSIYGEDPSLHQNLGWVYQQEDRWDEAETQFKAAVAGAPTPENWNALGELYIHHDRPAEALEAYRKAIERSSEGDKNWYVYGEAALAAGDPKEALAAAERALSANRYTGAGESLGRNLNARALVVKGVALMAMFQTDAAIAALEQAVKLSPTEKIIQGPLHAGLADAYYQTGRRDDAARAYRQAEQLGAADGAYGPLMKRLQWQLGLR